MLRRIRRAALAASVCVAMIPPAMAQTVEETGGAVEWPVCGARRYAQPPPPLDQIDASTVGALRGVWRWPAANSGPRPEARTATTPLMIGGVLYATAGVTRNIVAIDA